MVSTLIVRPAAPGDLPDMVDLLVQLGYPARPEALSVVLDALLGDSRYAVLVAEHPGDGVVAMIALSSRPVLRLQGWLGTIEELVVKRGMRDRGIGDRMVQHAKGLATERGWTRLETAVSRTRESSRRGFLLSRGFAAGKSVTYHWGMLDRHRFEVIMKGQRVDLTPKEFDLLAALVGTPGRVFGREELLDLVWGEDGFVEPRTVDVHVARLRAKFTAARLPVPGIETVRGVGYRFREQDPARLGSRN